MRFVDFAIFDIAEIKWRRGGLLFIHLSEPLRSFVRPIHSWS
jgi:hypothetical protein